MFKYKIKISIAVLLGLFIGTGCDREDLNDLYRQAEENERIVRQLEGWVDDMNREIATLHDLTQALMQRLYITAPPEKKDGKYHFTFGNNEKPDSIEVVLQPGIAPVLEIDPETKHWLIDGADTGVPAVGKDGKPATDPQIRIGEDHFWEYTEDGINWTKTQVKATGAQGEAGAAPQIGINAAGHWTIDGTETVPPVYASGGDGADAMAPLLDIDKNTLPYQWKISLDGGNTWQMTGINAQASNGSDGTSTAQVPYIKQITVDNDKITFIFSDNIPGVTPATNKQVVTLQQNKLSLNVPLSQFERLSNGDHYFFFGASETRVLNFTVSGTDIVDVSAVNLPTYLTARVELSANKQSGKVYLTSSKDANISPLNNNFFQLLVTNARGEYATEVIRINRVYKVSFGDESESYIYFAMGAGNLRVCTRYRYNVAKPDGINLDPGSYYYYGYSFFWSYSRSITPYRTVTKPFLVNDIDGNTYKVCRDNNHYWMIGNLKTTHYSDGSPIAHIKDNARWAHATQGAYSYYNHDVSKEENYGLLYNGYAVQSGKLCPKGWRVATDNDWLELEGWLESTPASQLARNGWRGQIMGNRVKWKTGWSGYTSYDPQQLLYPLEALPGGTRNDDGSTFRGESTSGFWWTATPDGGGTLFYRQIDSGAKGIYRGNAGSLNRGMSVRCVKDISDTDV